MSLSCDSNIYLFLELFPFMSQLHDLITQVLKVIFFLYIKNSVDWHLTIILSDETLFIFLYWIISQELYKDFGKLRRISKA